MEKKNTTHSTNRDGLLLSESRSGDTTSSDFVLQWGNRKRLRCMKVQGKGHSINNNNNNNDPTRSGAVHGATTRVDSRVVRSRVVRSDLNSGISKDPVPNQQNNNRSNGGGGNGYLNLRQRPASPSHRTFRNNPESSIGMKGNINGVRRLASPDGGDKKGTNTAGTNNNISNNDINNNNQHHRNNKNSNSNHYNDNHHGSGGGGGSGSSEIAREGSSSGDGDTITAVWPPKFVIALTNKEKEEDFMAIKGSKLPQRPKKRAKFVQRTLNLVSPGAWLCDLTLERYEVREKKVTKKRPRGLKAMGNMDSDSE